MTTQIIATIVWLMIGIVLLAFILKHNIGKVLKRILITYGILGVVFAALLLSVNHTIFNTLYHAWVTTLIFTLIMVILAVGGK